MLLILIHVINVYKERKKKKYILLFKNQRERENLIDEEIAQ